MQLVLITTGNTAAVGFLHCIRILEYGTLEEEFLVSGNFHTKWLLALREALYSYNV
jgi:hypothetical protein